jgi:NAD(P)-dependent dehydrogenase (short-subunit alcohol dehydrogenase family)
VALDDAFSLTGRSAIVTGAGAGIGCAIAFAFAQAGSAVACVDIDGETAAATARAIGDAGARAMSFACDVSSEQAVGEVVKSILKEFSPIRILINAAAGHDPNGTILDLSLADWNRVFAVNVGGAFLMSRAFLPSMASAGGGSIVHVASQLGSVAAPGRAVYCSTKGALIQLAKAMAVDHAAQNIRVNTLSPGAVETDRLVKRFGDMETARRLAGPKHLLQRLGQPEEIARAAVFLASDASSFVTGSDLLIDGGYNAT